jgi:dipeptidase E
MRIALAGGGGKEDSVLIDRRFAAWLEPGGALLYIPVALRWPEAEYARAYAWITSLFRPLGIDRIEMWTRLGDHAPAELQAYAGVYLGGGNTYSLLHQLRRSGFDEGLIRFAESGRPLSGGSAGAAVLGCDIASVAHLDANDVGLADTSGMDLALGASAWVHYTPGDDPRIARYVADTGQQLFVMSERAGIAVEGDIAWSVGYEPAFVVDREGRRDLSAGADPTTAARP